MCRKIGQATGWKTVCLDYPSRRLPLQDLAVGLAEEIRALAGTNGKVFAITHSMGGIVLRHIMGLENHGSISWLGAILLAPPNNGSVVARILSQVGPNAASTQCGCTPDPDRCLKDVVTALISTHIPDSIPML